MYCWIQSQHIVLHPSRIKNAKYFQNSISDKYNAPGTLDILSDGGTNTYTYLQSPSTQPLLCYTRGWCEDVAIAETICLFGSVSCYSHGSNMRVHCTLYTVQLWLCSQRMPLLCHQYLQQVCLAIIFTHFAPPTTPYTYLQQSTTKNNKE